MRMLQRHRRLGLSILALAKFAIPAWAQVVDQPSPPKRLAIRNARIVIGPGRIIENGTIVMRDGLVSAVGASASIGPDVWVIDGAGLTVYPGLINGLSTIGLPAALKRSAPAPQGAASPPVPTSWGPEDRPATFTWQSAADHLVPTDDAITKWRDAGFTTAVIVGDKGFFAGQAAVVNLAGERASDMVVRTPVAQRVNLTPGPGHRGYPEGLMGVVAYLKQVLLDAAHYDLTVSAYEATPTGMARPAYDRALEPLRATLKQGRPVLYPGNYAREIERVFDVARETSITPIIYGGQEGYRVAAAVARHKVPVLVNLDWPARSADGDPDAEPPLATLRFRDRAPTTPAELEKAGARFAFYAGGTLGAEKMLENLRKAIAMGLSQDAALRALTAGAAEIYGVADRIGTLEVGKIANAVVTTGNLFDAKTKVRYVVVDGRLFERPVVSDTAKKADSASTVVAQTPVPMVVDRGPVREPKVVLIRNATVMTVTGPTLTDASVLVRDGKIAAVGKNVSAPSDAYIIEGQKRYVIPGIIDAHSHISTDEINEGAVNVSAMVAIRDVINPDDVSMYRALAGGVTSANILHGSANPIGGQNAVIKLRWGSDAAGLLFEGAPPGIKFALGENPKRAGGPERYPQSRMGVQDVVRQAFIEAEEYRRKWREYEKQKAQKTSPAPLPPRRDLKLQTLAEILDGKRQVHAHSYRADEILQLIRVAEERGFKIAAFQHVLEGYKVANEIAAHGAGASTFSDWWAYKFEVYDAIPYNAALMTERGVVVSINSDSEDEMRHLNQEAAKSIKWGGLSETEALKLVTLNPAKQLGVANRVGSIEVGKDADLVVYEGHPLSPYGVVQFTLVDGKIYFDRQHDIALRSKLAAEKKALLDRQKGGRSATVTKLEEEGGAR